MPAILSVLAMLVAGVCVALQPPTNAALAKASGSVVLAALVSFAVGTAILFAVWLGGSRAPLASLRGVPFWAWGGGLYGAVFVSAAAFAAPRIGLAATLTFLIVGQLAAALVLDHHGLLGLPRHLASLARIGGVALVLAGALLVRRG